MFRLRKHAQKVPNSPLAPGSNQSLLTSQDGFTLIESLVSLLVAALLLTGIAPMVALSVAARVQSKRIDVATQAARTYIDGLRAGVFDPPSDTSANFASSAKNLGVTAPTSLPTGNGTCFNPKDPSVIDASDTKCDTTYSFVIQAFRDGDSDTTTAKTAGYCLGIRVYRRDAFVGMTPAYTEPTKSIFSASAGNKNYPLVVMRTEMVNRTAFSDYEKRYKDSSGTTKTTPCK
jgi:prepilin-type N-terminal cleavage/methylation domain-containing protein